MYNFPIYADSEATRAQGVNDLTKGQVFLQGISEGVTSGPTGALQRAEQIGLDQPYLIQGDSIVDNPLQPKPITKEEWVMSDSWRSGIKYEDGMTDYRAQLLASTEDKKSQDAYVDAHWKGFFAGTVKTLGNLAGGLLDPTNYIPMVGEAAMAERIGVTGAKVASGALTLGGLNAAAQGLDIATGAQLQQDPDWQAAARNVGIAALLGGTMGLFSSFLGRHSVEDRTTGTAKALDDMSKGEPVDVGPVLKPPDGMPLPEGEKLPDFSVAASQERAMPELAPVERTPTTDTGMATGAPDIGVRPEVQQQIEQRFKDLAESPSTAYLAEGADVSADTKTLKNRAAAWTSAALCMMREVL